MSYAMFVSHVERERRVRDSTGDSSVVVVTPIVIRMEVQSWRPKHAGSSLGHAEPPSII